MTNERISYLDHEVVDEAHNTVGKVTDVIYDGADVEPEWLVVKPGVMQAERLLPIERSYTTEDGNIVVPFDKKWLKSAPKVGGDHVVTTEDKSRAEAHYSLGDN